MAKHILFAKNKFKTALQTNNLAFRLVVAIAALVEMYNSISISRRCLPRAQIADHINSWSLSQKFSIVDDAFKNTDVLQKGVKGDVIDKIFNSIRLQSAAQQPKIKIRNSFGNKARKRDCRFTEYQRFARATSPATAVALKVPTTHKNDDVSNIFITYLLLKEAPFASDL